MQRVHFQDFWGFLGTSIVSCVLELKHLEIALEILGVSSFESPEFSDSKLKTHKHHRKSKLKFGKSFRTQPMTTTQA